MSVVLKLDHVSRVLTGEVIPVTLVDDVSCAIKKGEFVTITGASGSGKSSLLYLMGLLDRPTKGRVEIDGRDVSAASEEERQKTRLEKIGFVFQFHFLLQEFSALDNILLPMRKKGGVPESDMRQRGEKLLSMLGLGKAMNKMPYQLSGGERQRVAIARALANNPLLILADEPTGNLDSKNAATVIALLRKLSGEEGVTVITVTHDTDIAAQSDRSIVMRDGKIAEGG